MLAAVSSLTENDLVIDTGAGVSIFKNNDHVYDLYDDNEMIEMHGLTDNKKQLHSSVQGRTLFGIVYVSDRSIANVVSYGRLKNHAWAVWQEADNDVFRVQMTRGGKVYQFERKCGVYVYNTSSNVYALVSTVSDNLKLYSNVRYIEQMQQLTSSRNWGIHPKLPLRG